MSDFVLAWSSGHPVPRPVYYCETADRHPDATYNRASALRFRTRRAAITTWRQMHRFPEEFEHCIQCGAVRAEPVNAPMLCLVGLRHE